MILTIGAFLGFFSVAFGAFSEHGLRPNITEEQFRFLMTAIRYNQVNSVAIISLGFFIRVAKDTIVVSLFEWSGKLFILGTVLFCFSIYTSVGLGIEKLTYVTPVGGTVLMIAWITLLLASAKANRKS